MNSISKTSAIGSALLSMLLLASSCRTNASIVILQREWTANAEFAGDVWAKKVAADHGLSLEVREGSEVIDPIKMVRSRAAQFGVASSDRVLEENERGAGLVVLAAASYKSPTIFLTQPSLHIKSPADFKGRRIGIQAGTNTDLVFRALIATAHLSPSEMTIVDPGFGITTFETRTLDVMGAFVYDEPVQLDIKHIAYGTVDPEKFGVNFVGTVYFATKSFVDRNPMLVQRFLDALLDGWSRALKDPTAAVDLLAADFPSIDKRKELRSFEIGRSCFSGEDGYLLYASKQRWNQMAAQLISMGYLKNFVFDNNVNYSFLYVANQKNH